GLERTDERVAWILRLGAFNLLREEGLASSIAVDVAVRLARECGRSGLAGLVNAVLRRLAVRHAEGALALPDPLADPVGHLAVATALPRWLARKWLEELGPVEALQLGLGLNRPPPLTVRVQPPATVEEMRTWLASQGIVSRPASRAPDALVLGSPGSLAELEAASAGRLFVQDEAAILVGHLVAPGPASVVLDACAAPGGKAAHLRGLVGEDGEVHARDTGEGRIRLLQAVASRVDLLVAARDLLDPPRPEDIDRFDAVLLDAPCSNLGTLRRHPEAKARLEEGIVERSAELQRLMIAAAAPLVQPGGLLVFSVCSIAPEEGWGVVDRFLATGAGKAFFPEHPPQEALFAGLLDCRGALQTLPHRDDMDGFFALRLRRETR
ncbi:MAG: hypothetical protein FJ125_16515, partial [Deltaproteobacteria bacterium]|nr:hypothetical protein [Deltaproteobacteria bacterium]